MVDRPKHWGVDVNGMRQSKREALTKGVGCLEYNFRSLLDQGGNDVYTDDHIRSDRGSCEQ